MIRNQLGTVICSRYGQGRRDALDALFVLWPLNTYTHLKRRLYYDSIFTGLYRKMRPYASLRP